MKKYGFFITSSMYLVDMTRVIKSSYSLSPLSFVVERLRKWRFLFSRDPKWSRSQAQPTNSQPGQEDSRAEGKIWARWKRRKKEEKMSGWRRLKGRQEEKTRLGSSQTFKCKRRNSVLLLYARFCPWSNTSITCFFCRELFTLFALFLPPLLSFPERTDSN